jgi:co-chaperonin GroES (HSP10)
MSRDQYNKTSKEKQMAVRKNMFDGRYDRLTVSGPAELVGQAALNQQAQDMLNKVSEDQRKHSAVEIVLDSTNEVSFPGYDYKFRALGETILVSIDIFRTGYECKDCEGKGKVTVKVNREDHTANCPRCNGTGAWLHTPDKTKQLPTTGVIVSLGKIAQTELAKEDIGIGDRVLFGAYAGTMIPTKANLPFKFMDWNLARVKITGASVMDAFDFTVIDDN